MTLQRLLEEYGSIHFRDYMALQLTRMSGTTAYADRMGDRHEDLVKSGRIVQGHSVSGPLDENMTALVNRDLADAIWRAQFHVALVNDRRFQRGLFELTHGVRIGDTLVPGPAAWLRLIEDQRLRERLGEAASAHALEIAAPKAVGERVEAVWRTVV